MDLGLTQDLFICSWQGASPPQPSFSLPIRGKGGITHTAQGCWVMDKSDPSCDSLEGLAPLQVLVSVCLLDVGISGLARLGFLLCRGTPGLFL